MLIAGMILLATGAAIVTGGIIIALIDCVREREWRGIAMLLAMLSILSGLALIGINASRQEAATKAATVEELPQ